jgi:hypothetical protein
MKEREKIRKFQAVEKVYKHSLDQEVIKLDQLTLEIQRTKEMQEEYQNQYWQTVEAINGLRSCNEHSKALLAEGHCETVKLRYLQATGHKKELELEAAAQRRLVLEKYKSLKSLEKIIENTARTLRQKIAAITEREAEESMLQNLSYDQWLDSE